jgi:hypothetical protein
MIPVVDILTDQIANAGEDRPNLQQQCKNNANDLAIAAKELGLKPAQ